MVCTQAWAQTLNLHRLETTLNAYVCPLVCCLSDCLLACPFIFCISWSSSCVGGSEERQSRGALYTCRRDPKRPSALFIVHIRFCYSCNRSGFASSQVARFLDEGRRSNSVGWRYDKWLICSARGKDLIDDSALIYGVFVGLVLDLGGVVWILFKGLCYIVEFLI